MDPTLLLLGTGEPACETARLAREAGLRVVATDADARSPLRRWAPRFHALAATELDALVELAAELAREAPLAGVHPTGDAALPAAAALVAAAAVPGPPAEALATTLDPDRCSSAWTAAGLPVASGSTLAANAFFRDGACVPAGVFELQPAGGRLADLAPDELRTVHDLVARGARVLGLDAGPVSAHLERTAGGFALASLRPRFLPEAATAQASRIAYGKSPLQAHFADLAGAGGPFDEMPGASRACAGWREVEAAVPGVPHQVSDSRTVLTLPGVSGLAVHNAPDRTARACVWVEGATPAQVDERLERAAGTLQLTPVLAEVA